MKYFRLKKGKIIDLDKIIEQEKRNEYYTDYKFDDLKNTKDGCKLEYSCISNLIEPKGKLCNFAMICDSPFIAQADSLEELCDEFVYVFKNQRPSIIDEKEIEKIKTLDLLKYVYAGIWTNEGLIYIAKMNDKGELELL